MNGMYLAYRCPLCGSEECGNDANAGWDVVTQGSVLLGEIKQVGKLHKGQVEQAGFAVLKAPDIPSILVETAFISNVEEERKLKTAKFQQEVAESILAGIKAYFADGATLARRG